VSLTRVWPCHSGEILDLEHRTAAESELMQQKASTERRDRRGGAASSTSSPSVQELDTPTRSVSEATLANTLANRAHKLHDNIRQSLVCKLLQPMLVCVKSSARDSIGRLA
jgi:hypothetical protein